MRLVSYSKDEGAPRAGAIVDDSVVDLTALLGRTETLADVGALLRDEARVLEELPAHLESPPLDAALADVRLHSPIIQPPSIRDFAAFERHMHNAGVNNGIGDLPGWHSKPVFYFSNPHTVLGPDEEIELPTGSDELDYELEVAMVIGREGRNVAAADALDHVAGFVLFNDWSARDLCREEVGGLGLHKGKDFAQGLGPWVLTVDELIDRISDGRLDLPVKARVNGEVWSDSTTADMYWSIGDLIAYATRDSIIVPGDVIGFGTVGDGCIFERPQEYRWLEVGDVVELDGGPLGTLRQSVVPAKSSTSALGKDLVG